MKRLHKLHAAMLLVPIAFAVIVLSGCSGCFTQEFSLDDYRDYCAEYPLTSDGFSRNNPIGSRIDAIDAARKTWSAHYNPTEYSHCEVCYDPDNDCWMISGMSTRVWCAGCSPFCGMTGGVHNVILSADGKVLAIWQDM